MTVRIVGESISNVRSSGVCFDAGIRYKSGDKLNFGIHCATLALPCVTQVTDSRSLPHRKEQRHRSPCCNAASVMSFLRWSTLALAMKSTTSEAVNATLTGQFISNSFTKDQFGGGLELNLGDNFTARGGYLWEDGVGTEDAITTAFTGPQLGSL
jgi:hypothetical protein